MTEFDGGADLAARIAARGLIDPTDRPAGPVRRAAMAPETLEGLRGGFLDNRKGNADVILEAIRQRLAERYGMGEAVVCAKWVFSAPAGPEVIDALAQCDFVVTAVGD